MSHTTNKAVYKTNKTLTKLFFLPKKKRVNVIVRVDDKNRTCRVSCFFQRQK